MRKDEEPGGYRDCDLRICWKIYGGISEDVDLDDCRLDSGMQGRHKDLQIGERGRLSITVMTACSGRIYIYASEIFMYKPKDRNRSLLIIPPRPTPRLLKLMQ